MKKGLLFIALMAIGVFSKINAQDNSVKINTLGLSYRNVILQYERSLNDKIGVQLGLNFVPKGSIPFISRYSDAGMSGSTSGGTGEISTDFADMKFSGFGLTPELRFYPGGNGMKGFYLSGWIKYSNYKISDGVFVATATSDNEGNSHESATVDITGKYNVFGGGLGIGTHWVIADVVTLDVNWIGVGYGPAKFSVEAEFDNTYSDDELADIANEYEGEYSLDGLFATGVEVDGNTVTSFIKTNLPIFRFGFSLGYRF